MPVVEFNIKELEKLTDKTLTKEILEEKIPMLGCDIEHIDDEKVRYEVFPNRPDMLSQEGFARALKYFFGLDKGIPEYKTEKSGIKLNREKVKARPKITAAAVKNIKLTDEILRSLMQTQEKLHKTLGRERRKLAIGIHDLDKVEPPFTYKAVKPNKFKFKPLNWNQELTLKQIQEKHEKGKYADILEGNEKWPVITDKNGQTLSFPPVINSKTTEVTENTENLFIDVTGTDQETIERALNIVVNSLRDREGEISTVEVEGLGERPYLEPEEITIDLEYVNEMLGTDFRGEKFKKYVEEMGYDFKGKIGMSYTEEKTILIPPYRTDIMHPIDIVEDIAIRHGYDQFNTELPTVATTAKSNKETDKKEKLKELIIGYGYQEVKNMVLTNKQNQFTKMNKEPEQETLVELKNPLDKNHSICRNKALPQLLKNLSNNQHVSYPQKIFELAKCLELDEKSYNKVKAIEKLAIAKTDTQVNYNEITALLDSFMKNLGIGYELKKTKDPTFMKGRRAAIIHQDKEIGRLGEIHPKVLNNWDIEKPVIALEIEIDKFL